MLTNATCSLVRLLYFLIVYNVENMRFFKHFRKKVRDYFHTAAQKQRVFLLAERKQHSLNVLHQTDNKIKVCFSLSNKKNLISYRLNFKPQFLP